MRQKRIPVSVGPTPSEQQALGRAVRELRVVRGLSQEELGYRSRTHRNYIGVVERGESNPTFESILRLLYGLDVSLDELEPRE